MRTELWLDNCSNIAIHYSTYPVEPHFNFLIRRYVPEPYQAGTLEPWDGRYVDSDMVLRREIDR